MTEPAAGRAEAHAPNAEFQALLAKAVQPTSTRTAQLETGVQTLALWATQAPELIADDTRETLAAIVGEIDRRIHGQLNAILHQPEFQQLESAWRGLHYLVSNSETGPRLKIRVLNVAKSELHRVLRNFRGTMWDQSPIFKKLYGEEYDQLGGEPYGCLVGDYYFDHNPKDVELLGEMSKIAAAIHAPFLSGVSPKLFRFESFSELNNPRDLTALFKTAEYVAWRALRGDEDTRYLGLTLPRFLARLPYGVQNPVDDLAFEEQLDAADASHYCWANAAYALAVNVNRAFSRYGWCSQIRGVESGGTVEDLPTHSFETDDDGVDTQCPLEVAIDERRDLELANIGLIPLSYRKTSDVCAFLSAQSLQQPTVYRDADATASAQLSARLPYLFACCRFAHYLKVIMRDKLGSLKARDEVERLLQDWITHYVHGSPSQASEAEKAEKPLAGAEIRVEEAEDNPGRYSAKFHLRPHYQLEGFRVSLALTSRLPVVPATR